MITLILKSFDQFSIQQALQAVGTEFPTWSSHYHLPTSSKTYTLLRSPHGNKDARESLSVNTYKAVVYLHVHESHTGRHTVSRISNLQLYGVQMQIIWTQAISISNYFISHE